MANTAALPSYRQYAGYGHDGYSSSIDDPRRLPTQFHQPPEKDDAWPSWAAPAAAVAAGVVGLAGARGLGKMMYRGGKKLAPKIIPKATPAVKGHSTPVGHMTPTPGAVGRSASGQKAVAGEMPVRAPGAEGVQIAPEYAEALGHRGYGIKTSSILLLLGQIARRG